MRYLLLLFLSGFVSLQAAQVVIYNLSESQLPLAGEHWVYPVGVTRFELFPDLSGDLGGRLLDDFPFFEGTSDGFLKDWIIILHDGWLPGASDNVEWNFSDTISRDYFNPALAGLTFGFTVFGFGIVYRLSKKIPTGHDF